MRPFSNNKNNIANIAFIVVAMVVICEEEEEEKGQSHVKMYHVKIF